MVRAGKRFLVSLKWYHFSANIDTPTGCDKAQNTLSTRPHPQQLTFFAKNSFAQRREKILGTSLDTDDVRRGFDNIV